jgi:LPS O-antigen subunit length determinant protein (WzzB/FepE family)
MNPQTQPPTDEITLRELYLLFKKWSLTILGVALGMAVLAFAVSQLLPRTYTSQVTLSLSLANHTNQVLLQNLPPLAGLAQGLVEMQNTRLMAEKLEVTDPTQFYSVRFDERRGLLLLTARGQTAAEARARSERILNVTREYLENRLSEGMSANISAAYAQVRLDLQVAQGALQGIQALLRTSPSPDLVASNPTLAAALEAHGIDPQVARTANPAFTSLSLDESRLRSQIAQLEPRINLLTEFLQQPERIGQLVSLALLIQVLVPPAEPLGPTSPRPLLFTVIGGVLGLLLGVLWASVAEAIRPRQAEVARQPGVPESARE